MASTYLTRTFETATDRKKCTISFWIKKGFSSETQQPFCSYYTASYRLQFYFENDDKITIYNQDNGTDTVYLSSKAAYRDCNAWYHCYAAIDTTLATETDRVKVYINGERYTDWNGTTTYPSQNSDMSYGSTAYVHNIGRYGGGNHYVNGSLSHYYFVDGSVIDVSQFGSTDSTTGEWKISTNPTIASYGNSGCKMFINNASVDDQSGNGNNFTLSGGTLTKTEDSPSNVFATLNPLAAHPSNTPIFYNGNTTSDAVDTSPQTISSTLAMPKKGKFYMEVKLAQEANSTSSIPNFGIMDAAALYKMRNKELTDSSNAWNSYGGRVNSNNIYVLNATSQTMSDTPDVGDIIGLAVDLDSAQNTLKYYLNGTLVATQNINNDEYVFCFSIKRDNEDAKVECNFGNGYFATTQITSEGTNASGIGKFEYDVPSGYTALCTKGLNL